MLINLSGTPSAQWAAAMQTAATTEFKDILDIEPPSIDPTADTFVVMEHARDYYFKVKDLLPEASQPLAVFIDGEMSFSFAIVTILRQMNIRCSIATRDAQGEFTRFRDLV